MQRLLTGIVVILVILGSAWWAASTWGMDLYITQGPCGTERVRTATTEIVRIGDGLNNLSKLWNNPPGRGILKKDMVIRIEQLLDEARLIHVPLCMRGVKEHMVSGLESLISYWVGPVNERIIFMDSTGYDGAVTNFIMAEQEMAEIERCVPFCESILFNQLFP